MSKGNRRGKPKELKMNMKDKNECWSEDMRQKKKETKQYNTSDIENNIKYRYI